MLLPALAALVVVTLLPTLYLLVVSFTPLDLTRPGTAWDFSTPFAKYQYAWNDSRLHNSSGCRPSSPSGRWRSRWHSACSSRSCSNSSSKILLALRTVFLIPMVLPPIVVAIIWKVIYTPDISPMHWALEAMGFPSAR
jgi:multiple sugar transport system permease protein